MFISADVSDAGFKLNKTGFSWRNGMSKTKYDSLIEAWAKSHNEYVTYRRECLDFIKKAIVYGLPNYLGKPECVDLYNLKDGFDLKKRCGWGKSISLEDDTFWHLGAVLSLEVKNAARYILLHLALKKEGSDFLIKIEDWDLPPRESEFRLDPNNDDELNKFHETIFRKVKEDIESGFANFLNRKRKPKTIGFLSVEDESADE